MHRGYLKFWRKAQDSASWNRGLMYQGLIINLLNRAAWKKGSYQGKDLHPGQFGAVLNQLAESLDVPRSTFKRMVAHLAEDDFIHVQNVGHRFSIITIVNWERYQSPEDDAWAAHGPPMVNQRAAHGPPSYKEEESKKEESKNITPPPPPLGGVNGEIHASQAEDAPREKPKSKRKTTGNSASELDAAIEAYTENYELRGAWRSFREMRERKRAPLTGDALRLAFRKIDELSQGDDAQKIAILEQSILHSWQGIFPLKPEQQSRASPAITGPPPLPKTYVQAQDMEKRQRSLRVLQRLETKNGDIYDDPGRTGNIGGALTATDTGGRPGSYSPYVVRDVPGHDGQ